ncbi:hypothetical protein E3T33_05470 [Cryobacterium sp. TMT1-2-1]|uniref:hypothetical protein n=1 Tax=Cryobacterium sp. TMT1-2-1 TaxID=1259232 RepID=UPI0010694A83|nr:hypothetical protein [Cryobacterium sp. TMT1-2-1]TFD46243.1 hypothetical protein E3T33_05470 [Cryobacterium sp. TMT1-2-1]
MGKQRNTLRSASWAPGKSDTEARDIPVREPGERSTQEVRGPQVVFAHWFGPRGRNLLSGPRMNSAVAGGRVRRSEIRAPHSDFPGCRPDSTRPAALLLLLLRKKLLLSQSKNMTGYAI